MSIKKIGIFCSLLLLAHSSLAQAEIDSFQIAIRTVDSNGKTYFEHCETHDHASFCKPISNLGIDSDGMEDFEKYCRELRLFGPIENIAFTILIGGAGTVIGVAIGTPGGVPGIAAGAVLGTSAGGAAASFLAPPIDSKSIGTALRYVDGVKSKNAYYFSADKVLQAEKGLTSCLKRYERFQRVLELEIEEEKNSRYGPFLP